MIASKDDFVSHVAAHAGISADRAERATLAVLAGLGASLSAPSRQLVASELPEALAAALLVGEGLAIPIEERVIEPGTTVAQARELIASVCRVLAEELSIEAGLAVRDGAPAAIGALLVPPAREELAYAAVSVRGERLAAGRPGSRHPVSEAHPQGAQTGSIAADNPHAESKLSSATGSTQERLHESLAEGRPGPAHSIAGPRR